MPAAQPARRPARPTARATRANRPAEDPVKDRPVVEDIRLLGRILGDVIREQDGTGPTNWSSGCASSRWPTA